MLQLKDYRVDSVTSLTSIIAETEISCDHVSMNFKYVYANAQIEKQAYASQQNSMDQ